ncbi:hypothetical protein CspeluHIS016_0402290 [Cutaneotrichosporon spelunceum]|uniref:Uncharacterized protein n=1 Tax=Cutaneotrichosporon spelunceum TaxID=1672016 RepID=A0AAD3YBU0_9TREE|nr:hypothetical protein CspeluHIS016_0402290 [Cutaneotrichosporon spelunceum]
MVLTTRTPYKNPEFVNSCVLATQGLALVLAAWFAMWMIHALMMALISRCTTPHEDLETQPFLARKDEPCAPAIPSEPSYGSIPLPIRAHPSRLCEA